MGQFPWNLRELFIAIWRTPVQASASIPSVLELTKTLTEGVYTSMKSGLDANGAVQITGKLLHHYNDALIEKRKNTCKRCCKHCCICKMTRIVYQIIFIFLSCSRTVLEGQAG